MEISIDEFERKDMFYHYHSEDNPFVYITIKLDVTPIVNYTKIHKHNYATIGYLLGKTVNEVDNFRYRLVDDKIVYYDKVGINYTQKTNNGVDFYDTDFIDDYEEYIEQYDLVVKDFNDGKRSTVLRQDMIWLSCEIKFDFTGLITPYKKDVTIPQFIWGKYFNEGDRTYTHLMIMAHHGFVDGEHIADFVERLNKNIENFERDDENDK